MFSYSDSKETLCRPPVQRIFWRVSYGVNRTITQSNQQVLHTALQVINKSVYQLIMRVILALGHRCKRRRRREREGKKNSAVFPYGDFASIKFSRVFV